MFGLKGGGSKYGMHIFIGSFMRAYTFIKVGQKYECQSKYIKLLIIFLD